MIRATERQLNTADLASVANPPNVEVQEREREARFRENGPAEIKEVRPTDDAYAGTLVPKEFADDLRHQWESVQGQFVDEPKSSVQRADELVASAIKKLAETFASERTKLEQEWSKGNDVSTEDLRVALRRYRAFFQRLISI